MVRPRQYHSDAEKQAAYRARLSQETILLDRKAIETLDQYLLALQKAVWDAAERGDEFARKCKDTQPQTMLQRMIVAFNSQCPDGPPVTLRKEKNG